ncbi:U7 snRNA-associated Sm-like protein LSm11 [Protopterus annectens]|uniref:U7 snRNA-associated Sm-like protein LSm11 n=1 Tax=Protopterus annectens TaxID=7888 RepID=UPI001CF9B6F6|nr:U7 snRNA-associated Sm-like protein LSm11 [Protopterus annectens]
MQAKLEQVMLCVFCVYFRVTFVVSLIILVHAGSPLGELHRCVRDRIKISVHIRTFKGLRGVCSGFLVAFDKFWNMAMVDVDETYRKPVLGKAFYNEPKLNVTQLFERLQLQETSNVETPAAATYLSESSDSVRATAKRSDKQKSMSRSDKLDHAMRSKLVVDPIAYKASKKHKPVETLVKDSKSHHAGHQENTKQCRTKVDYQKVFKRHLGQLFIRGESILLVHLMQ